MEKFWCIKLKFDCVDSQKILSTSYNRYILKCHTNFQTNLNQSYAQKQHNNVFFFSHEFLGNINFIYKYLLVIYLKNGFCFLSENFVYFDMDLTFLFTGIMAASEIPPQMANFQTFSLKDIFFLSGGFFDTLHTAILC